MLFSKKSKEFFIELNDHAVMMARVSAQGAARVIEEMCECPLNDSAALKAQIAQLQPNKAPSGFLHAKVSVFPAKRLVRRHTLEAKRIRDAGYLAEICSQQFRVEQDKYTISLLNAGDGLDFDAGKMTSKDVLFCGLPSEDVVTIQSSLLKSGIYPEAIELGSVATLGSVVDFLAQSKSKSPVLVLEIGSDTTHSFIVTASGVEASRPVAQGFDGMVPLVQKELGLKDEESARRLFYSNTFDFTGMGPLLTKKLLKELQSSIGFYEVQTGQSVGYVLTTQLPPKLQWLEASIASVLGISTLKLDPLAWLESQQVSVPEPLVGTVQNLRWLGLLGLIVQPNHAAHAAVPEEKK